MARKRRRTTRKRHRRTSHRKRARGSRGVGIQRIVGFGDRQIVHLKYVGSENLGGASVLAQHDWNINSLNDPDRSGIGHQPMAYDQWSAFYSRYRVVRCDFKVHISADSSMSGAGAMALMIPQINAPAAYTDLATALENRHAKSRNIQLGANVVTMKRSFNLAKVLGQPRKTFMGSDQNQAQVGSNPAQILCCSVVVASMDLSTNVNCNLTYEIVYTAILFEPNTLSAS